MQTPAVTVNGRPVPLADAGPHTTALDWLRGIGLTGAKEGCAEGECGACAVLVARAAATTPAGPAAGLPTAWTAVNACLLPAASLDGQEVVTAEGLGTPDDLHPVQAELAVRGGSQCGFCTPGFVCSMAAEYYRADREGGDARCRAGRQRVRPARRRRQPVPLHRLPPDPRRRVRPRRTGRRRPAGRALLRAAACGPADQDQQRRRRVRPTGRPAGDAAPAGEPPRRHGRRRVDRLGGRRQPARARAPR